MSPRISNCGNNAAISAIDGGANRAVPPGSAVSVSAPCAIRHFGQNPSKAPAGIGPPHFGHDFGSFTEIVMFCNLSLPTSEVFSGRCYSKCGETGSRESGVGSREENQSESRLPKSEFSAFQTLVLDFVSVPQ